MKKSVFLVFLVLLSGFCAAKDMFRVHETILVEMEDELAPKKAQLAVNDMLAVKLPQNPVFLKGLSFEIKIPKAVADYRDAVAFSIYTNISPVPAGKVIDYSGEKLYVDTFPGKFSYNLQIPLIPNHGLKETPYSDLLPYVIDISEGWVYFRLQLVMKGTPVSVLEAVFDIEIKPVVIDMGLLDISILYPDPNDCQQIPVILSEGEEPDSTPILPAENKEYAVFIDEKQVQLDEGKILLPSGVHHIALISEFYRNEVRSVKVAQAHISELEIQLKDNEPLLYISIPQSISCFFNDIQLVNFDKPYKIAEGEHILRFMLDGYEAVKVLQAFKGKNYTVSMVFDVEISEE